MTPACLPLRADLANALKERMACHLPAAKAFRGMWADRGAEMIRVDLEAAGILARDGNGDLVITNEYGLVYDFHSLRHTFASLLNQARVPLATAQKLMRHSDPKLTANIYTHVMVETKAEALAKLPKIVATGREDAAASKTGTDDAPSMPVGNRDNPRNTFSSNLNEQITTCMNARGAQNSMKSRKIENEKSLSHKGKQGLNVGTPVAIRTRDLRFRKRIAKPVNSFNINWLCRQKRA